jgi:hypothetical protein
MRVVLLFLAIQLMSVAPVFGINQQPHFQTSSQDPVLLRYNFSEGQVFDMKLDVKISMEIAIGGKSLPTQTVMPTASQCTIQSIGNDKITAEIQAERFSMTLDGPGNMHIVLDSNTKDSPFFSELNKAFQTPYQVTFTSRGELLELEARDFTAALKKVVSPALLQQFRKMVEQTVKSAFVQLPEAPVKAGDVYRAGTVPVLSFEDTMTEADVYYEVLAVSGDKKKVLLRPVTESSVQPSNDPSKNQKAKLLDGAIEGWILFDREKGNISESAGHVFQKLKRSIQGNNAMITTDMVFTYATQDKEVPAAPSQRSRK